MKISFSSLMVIMAFAIAGCSGISYPKKTNSQPENGNRAVGPQSDSSYFVATSQVIDPEGITIRFPGRPVDICYNKDESVIAVKNMYAVVFFDAEKKQILQTLRLPGDAGGSFTGLGWTGSGNNEKLWVTDTRGYLLGAPKLANKKFEWTDTINLPELLIEDKGGLDPGGLTVIDKEGPYPGGFCIDEESGYAYVTLNRNNSICVVNLRSKKIEKEIPVGIAPYTIIKKDNKLYVSNFGGRKPLANDITARSSGSPIVINPANGVASSGTVSVIDLASFKTIGEIPVGLHPGSMVLSNDKKKLYVANSNSDNISVINTDSDQFIKLISAKPLETLPLGSSPNAIAISGDSTLFICNGGNNAIGVFNVKENQLSGFIPAGWYPGAITINKAGTEIVVANIKGIGGRNQRPGKNGLNSHDHMGSISFIDVPDKRKLEEYNSKAMRTMQIKQLEMLMLTKKQKVKPVPIPANLGEPSVFKHVLYIIRENRTYDQIFGDIKQGNGDSSLCLFGRDITPNAHALADEFVLLDNTYCNGVNSADGHQWTNEGIATDYIEKSYGGFVRSYPCCAGEDPLAYASSGFIWNKVLDGGYTFRDYGEFVDAEIEPAELKWTDHYNNFINGKPMAKIRAITEMASLEPYICRDFIGFPETVPDVYRADVFINELKQFEKNDSMPNFMMMLLPNDHTAGTHEDYPTPRAMMADNDLALGRVVEAVSKSKFWKETVIFVIEDDAQDGLDHVDGRRTVALCISPYTKRNTVVSTMYNQNSILRTIELIFGLTPMTQFDLLANPMYDCFTSKPDYTPYTAKPNNIPLNEMNPKISTLTGKQSYWAKKSMEIPLEDYDLDEGRILSRILWYSVRGYDSYYPEHLEIKK
ncbi:MAG: alkaline phosphatase family protein [Chitinophagaceae bacterium]